jgi:hypothetical protein
MALDPDHIAYNTRAGVYDVHNIYAVNIDSESPHSQEQHADGTSGSNYGDFGNDVD